MPNNPKKLRNMKLLHTADWHLGQDFFRTKNREEEHRIFLDWLVEQLRQEQPDALIIAGDVFDSANPPQYALTQYYHFLAQAQRYCPNIIIVGGNHDSRYVLNAPRKLLRALCIHVVGGGTTIADTKAMSKQIIPLHNRDGKLIGAVAAVPFLREGEVRTNIAPAESYAEKISHLREGIKAYYQACLELLQPYIEQGLPIIATGHLYAAGSQLSDDEAEGKSERRIYTNMGNQATIDTDVFPAQFDYVALGHIHCPQIVGKKANIRYCGSPIPLSFGEINDRKQILSVSLNTHIIDTPSTENSTQVTNFGSSDSVQTLSISSDNHHHNRNCIIKIRPIEVPMYRRLLRINGTYEQVIAKIISIEHTHAKPEIWAEVIVRVDAKSDDQLQRINQLLADKNIIALPVVRQELNTADSNTSSATKQLYDFEVQDINRDPEIVFRQRCSHYDEASQEDLLRTYQELIEQLDE